MKLAKVEFQQYHAIVVIHGLFVIAGIVAINIPSFNLSIGVFRTGNASFVLPSICGAVYNSIIFYGTVFVLIPQFLNTQRYVVFFATLIGLLGVCSALECVSDYLLATRWNFLVQAGTIRFTSLTLVDESVQRLHVYGLTEIVSAVFVFNIPVLLLSFVYSFVRERLYHERLRQKSAREQLTAELALLKSQINPHFLFNTLNNLFSIAMVNKDEQTASGIARLAALMRFMLYESNDDNISLDKELDYIQNFISLQRLRFFDDKNPEIVFEITGTPETMSIAPMLCIPLVENAFKHGISLNTPSFVHIHCHCTPEKLQFIVRNSINAIAQNRKDIHSGIGLNNIRRRLELLYPGKYNFIVKNDCMIYEASVILYFQDDHG